MIATQKTNRSHTEWKARHPKIVQSLLIHKTKNYPNSGLPFWQQGELRPYYRPTDNSQCFRSSHMDEAGSACYTLICVSTPQWDGDSQPAMMNISIPSTLTNPIFTVRSPAFKYVSRHIPFSHNKELQSSVMGDFCGSSFCVHHAAVQDNEGRAIAVHCAPNLVLPHPYISLSHRDKPWEVDSEQDFCRLHASKSAVVTNISMTKPSNMLDWHCFYQFN